MIPFSILDLAPVREGSDVATALTLTRDLAQHAERWGYSRFWLAEHHGIPGVASAATSVVIGYVAEGTSTIRVGAGGIMLPNHPPLIIAEQFGTLASLYPGRIDLGLGRAPGSDQRTARALRRPPDAGDTFPQDVRELINWFAPPEPGQAVLAVPGAGIDVPIWILGSSLFGAQLAAAYGLPFAFASHFAPAMMMQAIHTYRVNYKSSERNSEPYVMLGFNIIAADTDDEARFLFSSAQQAFINLRTGRAGRLPRPVRDFDERLNPVERSILESTLAASAVGSPDTVRHALDEFIARTGADELMVTAQIHDHHARLRSYEIAASIRKDMKRSPTPVARMSER